MEKLTFEKVKDNFVGWAFLAIIGFGNYQLQKISDGLAHLNTQVTQVVSITTFHSERLDKQWTTIQANQVRLNDHELRIGRIEGRLEERLK